MACLRAVLRECPRAVYVDSGSSDGSVEGARQLGVPVVELSKEAGFTAARGRNAGLETARRLWPDLVYVQFVDGDCELAAGWLAAARGELEGREELAVVFGRRREEAPEASIYQRLCDLEWDVPVGEARSCGGDAMMRVAALVEAGGYDGRLVAGEEPDLCARLRANGWRIVCIDAEMTRHDAQIRSFGQYWRRAVRAGYAFAEVAHRHRASAERLWTRESRSTWFWTGLGVGILVAGIVLGWVWLWLLLVFPLQVLRIGWRKFATGVAAGPALAYGVFCLIAKWPQAVGQARFHWDQWRGRVPRLIEYKARAGR